MAMQQIHPLAIESTKVLLQFLSAYKWKLLQLQTQQ